MGIRTGKIWGTTELIVARPTFAVHRIMIEPGGYCSIHRHVDKVRLVHAL